MPNKSKGGTRELTHHKAPNYPPTVRYLCFVDDAGKLAYRELPDMDRSYDLFPHSADFGFVIVYHPIVLKYWGHVDTSWTRTPDMHAIE